MRAWAVWVLLACASGGACFDPKLGLVACGEAELCPAGLSCASDGFCRDPSQPPPIDGAVADVYVADVFVPDPDAAAVACADWMPSHFAACLIPEPSGDLNLDGPGAWRFDTDTFELSDPSDTPVSVTVGTVVQGSANTTIIVVDRFFVAADASLRVVGSRALIIAAFVNMDIRGSIDLTSRDSESGAGADPTVCGAGGRGENGVTVAGDDSGAGGGGFGGAGGQGGDSAGEVGGDGGVAVPAPSFVRGGCRGGRGSGVVSSPGRGGGAVQLSAAGIITISGSVLAGGQGGRGGTGDEAGGGGGSGGYIGLDAASITLTASAVLAANGGGGGGGAVNDNDGLNGEDGQASPSPALGGPATLGEGDGGAGGAGLMASGGDGALGGDGGGGGGGGVGHIIFRGAVSSGTAVVSPPATVSTRN